jgi:hypothetical protein
MYPRMAHRMTLIEFSDAAKATMLVNHGRNWEISLDGKSLGFGDGSEVDAIVQVHEREVNNALYACCNDAPSMFVGAVLPAAHALQSHPQLARIFPRESALVGRGWTEREAKLAELQGWNLFETVCESGKRLEIQACDGQYLLEEDLDAWVLVMNGQDDIHILARTEIAHKAPLEYCKILRAVLEARPTPSARPRQTQSA